MRRWKVLHLPGRELLEQGLADLDARQETVASLLVSVGAPRLRQLGIEINNAFPDAEHRLYRLLSKTSPDAAHSQYNALLNRLVSFERALACAR